ncbi:MAG TPA: hypothetical protein PLV92_22760, partial [Pirellulaceae bacterium]|nr:hypothetical protein [Pirellulaceae bacterium]
VARGGAVVAGSVLAKADVLAKAGVLSKAGAADKADPPARGDRHTAVKQDKLADARGAAAPVENSAGEKAANVRSAPSRAGASVRSVVRRAERKVARSAFVARSDLSANLANLKDRAKLGRMNAATDCRRCSPRPVSAVVANAKN